MSSYTSLNTALIEIAEQRTSLNSISYDNEKYDLIEDNLHELEDNFVDEYGEFIEDLLADIHEQLNLESEVLLPTAYIAKNYIKEGDTFSVNGKEGVMVTVEGYTNKDTRLVLLPNPFRVIMNIGGKVQKELWNSSDEE